MANSGVDEIQRLRAAEADALQQVSEARKYRKDRMRQAVADADASIAAYEAEKRAALNARHPEGTVDSAEVQSAWVKTQGEIEVLKSEFASNKEAGLDILLAAVTTVRRPA
ncbi:ATP6V1G1 [Symbiodinium sp. KB8]|nr:ATP6V1G1 [Symbiodinium sp. KB8]